MPLAQLGAGQVLVPEREAAATVFVFEDDRDPRAAGRRVSRGARGARLPVAERAARGTGREARGGGGGHRLAPELGDLVGAGEEGAARGEPALEGSRSVLIEGDAAEGIAALKKSDG